MALHEIARKALDEIRAIEDSGLHDGHDAEILAAIDKAMDGAIQVCCHTHAEVVEQHLSHATGVAEEINVEADKRRGLLIANLSALR
jgi:hypothetical protein